MSEYIRWIKEGDPGYYRIVEYLQSLEKVIKPSDKILELGTNFPFISDYFNRKYGNDFSYGGLEDSVTDNPEISKHFVRVNLCTAESYGTGDIVSVTEVIEHLPCNLYTVKDKLIIATKKYLFVTSPVAEIGRKDTKLEDELPGDWNTYWGHIKEFKGVEELKSLFKSSELEIVDEWFSESRICGTGSYCYNILFRKI